jgi:hypothetical protein
VSLARGPAEKDPFYSEHINTLEMIDKDRNAANKPPIVLIHGMGGGLGMFVRNLAPLRKSYRCMHMLHMRGDRYHGYCALHLTSCGGPSPCVAAS